MSRQLWNNVIRSKFFYVYTYRRAASYLLVSGILNIILFMAVTYVHFSEPERAYYATSGITPPVELSPSLHPNTSSEPLLSEEGDDGNNLKPIPN